MAIFTESYARLAHSAYLNEKMGDNAELAPSFKVVGVVDKASGYHGTIYESEKTGELVVAHRGTEFEDDPGRDLLTTDAQMGLLKISQQLDGAREAVELARELAKKTGAPVTVTGHSLGGALAQITAAEYGLRGETFNAYGAAGLHGTPPGGTQVVNHVRATDMVAAAGRHFGIVRAYATQEDVDRLLNDGTPPDRQSPRAFLADVMELHPQRTHQMEQFYGPKSITDGDHEELYQQHKLKFDAYRAQILGTTVSLRLGLPFTGLTPLGMAVYQHLGASYVANKLIDALDGPNPELQRLQNEARERQQEQEQAIQAKNANFQPPEEPLIYRNDDAAPARFDLREQLERNLGQYRSFQSESAYHPDRQPLVTDPRHPQHRLYAAIGERLPADTRPETIADIALKAMKHGITGPERLIDVAVANGHVYLQGPIPGDRVKADLNAPAPELAVTSEHLAQQAQQVAEPARQQQMVR